MNTKTEKTDETLDEAPKVVTEDDIVASMLMPKKSPEQGTDEGSDDADVEDDLDDDADDTDADDADVGSDNEDESDDDDSSSDDQEPEYLDIRDDDVVEVMVDGELQERTIGELKKALSGEGAIEKRLQEATEARTAAHAQATTTLEQLHAQGEALKAALSSLDDEVFNGVISAPSDELKKTNPTKYLQHKDAYDADQARIAKAKEFVSSKIKEIDGARANRLEEYAKLSAKEIARLIPDLIDPEKGTKTMQRMTETAKKYGYTDAEIASALDYRMFHLMDTAMKYEALMAAKGTGKKQLTDVSKQVDKAPRKLRSGGTRAKTIVAQSAKRKQAVAEKARSTGRVDDIAATLLVAKKG